MEQSGNSGKYAEKENYVTVNSTPELWTDHANMCIARHYSHVFRGDVCDLGCNHGACTMLLKGVAPGINSIHGFDLNSQAIGVANSNLVSRGHTSGDCFFVVANLLSLPVPDESFDVAVTFHTLEHIYPEDSLAFVKEVHRILRKGGHVLISIPYDHCYSDKAHVAFYTENTLSSLFETDGMFDTLECIKDERWNEKGLLTALFEKRS